MWKVTLLLTVLLADKIDIALSELPCDSALRIFRPELFTHCSSCFYDTWSRWERIDHMMHHNNCSSGYLHKVKRTRKDLNQECNDEEEIQYHCKYTNL